MQHIVVGFIAAALGEDVGAPLDGVVDVRAIDREGQPGQSVLVVIIEDALTGKENLSSACRFDGRLHTAAHGQLLGLGPVHAVGGINGIGGIIQGVRYAVAVLVQRPQGRFS